MEPCDIVCLRISDVRFPLITGTRIDKCAECKTDIGVSTTSRDIKKKKNARFICMDCMLKNKKFPEECEVRITREQLAELKHERDK